MHYYRTTQRVFLALLSSCLLLLLSTQGVAQQVALKTNLLYGGALQSPNLSLELRLAPRWSMELGGGANFFFYSTDPSSDRYKTKKISHWLVQPEVRYWTCEAFNGLFFGLHGQGGAFNLGSVSIPFVLENKSGLMKNHRYEGYFVGAGLSAGYHLILSKRWSMEAQLGFGYNWIHYDKFECVRCGDKLNDGVANYLGPTKAAISFVYLIK